MFLLRFSDCALHDSTLILLLSTEYKKIRVGLAVVHAVSSTGSIQLARL